MTDTPHLSISKVNITNFKCYGGKHSFELNDYINIFVGNNASGKSTILEAVHLALTGVFQGRYARNDLSQYLFNNECVDNYLRSIKDKEPIEPPEILIELFFKGEGLDEFSGNNNEDKLDSCGLWIKVCFDDKYRDEYEELLKREEISTLPIEYYDIVWESFARQSITPRTIPFKSALIDSSGSKSMSGSDLYISRIVKEILEPKDVVDVSQAHRKMRESFMKDTSIININTKIDESAKMTNKKISLAVDLSIKNSWESTLITYVDDIPFHFSGKGEQSIIKTKLALGHKKAVEANILILEEPENHLSHTSLNELLNDIEQHNQAKQVLISTHNSFVANKLGLDNITILHEGKAKQIADLSASTNDFFCKIAGYDTLRLVLCKKAILVEGDSDELVVQKAYMASHDNHLPIQDGIDVISVGTSFLRFLEIAVAVGIPVAVATDNDGDPDQVKKKYAEYIEAEFPLENVSVCFDEHVDKGSLVIGQRAFNYNTLEPKILKANGLEKINEILNKKFKDENEAHLWMHANKTDTALAIFKYEGDVTFPDYILDAVK